MKEGSWVTRLDPRFFWGGPCQRNRLDVPSVSNSSQHTRANLPDGWSTKTPSLLWLRCMVVSWYLKVHDPNVVSTGKFTSKPSVVISELELSDERPKHVKEGGRSAARGFYYPTFVREKRKALIFPQNLPPSCEACTFEPTALWPTRGPGRAQRSEREATQSTTVRLGAREVCARSCLPHTPRRARRVEALPRASWSRS